MTIVSLTLFKQHLNLSAKLIATNPRQFYENFPFRKVFTIGILRFAIPRSMRLGLSRGAVPRDAEAYVTSNLEYARIIYLNVAGLERMLRIFLTQQPVLRGALSHANRVPRGPRH